MKNKLLFGAALVFGVPLGVCGAGYVVLGIVEVLLWFGVTAS